MRGEFYGIGVGPGDPDLITMKAVKILQNLDIVIVPESRKKAGSVALEIARPYLKDDVEQLTLVFPMTRDWEALKKNHNENAAIIAKEIALGKKIAFLTLGDPMLYSTYSYLLDTLEEKGVKAISIPGIYSFSSISNLLNLPLVQGDEKLAVICDFSDETRTSISKFDTIVCMKVSAYHSELYQFLKEENKWQFQMVSQVGKPLQEVNVSIEALREAPHYFTTAIIKRVK